MESTRPIFGMHLSRRPPSSIFSLGKVSIFFLFLFQRINSSSAAIPFRSVPSTHRNAIDPAERMNIGPLQMSAEHSQLDPLAFSQEELDDAPVTAVTTTTRISRDPIFENVTVAIGINQRDPSFKFGGPCVADINGDGNYDFVLSNHNGKRTRIFFGKGDGTFSESGFKTKWLDIHGVTVALRTAHDRDRILSISVGGGKGTLLKLPEIYLVTKDKTFIDISEKYGLGKVLNRGRNTLFMDLAMRSTAMNRENLGGPDLLVTNYLGSPDDNLKQYAYENIQGNYSLHAVPGFDLQKRGRIEITDIDDDQNFELISIRDLVFYRLEKPFTFANVTADVFPPTMLISDLSVTAVAEADFDNDGYFDLYVARADKDKMTGRQSSYIGSRNDIYLHNQNGKYVNFTGAAGLRGFTDSMGVTVGDFDNDGFVDVFIVQFSEKDFFLMNNGNNTFRRVDGLIDKDPETVGNHAAAVDYDGDGRVDIIVGHGNTDEIKGRYTVMRNTMPFTDNNHWLLVRVGNEPSRAVTAMLAVVTVYIKGQRLKRRVGSRGAQGGGASYIDTVHFGLGSATRVDCVRVQWSNRAYRKVTNVAADQKIEIGEILL